MNEEKWVEYIKKFTGGIEQGSHNYVPNDNNHLGIGLNFFKKQNIDSKDKTFLDLGCGSDCLRKEIKAEWHGTDIFEQDYENYTKADCHALPYADKSFDIIFCNHVLEHVLAPYICIQEMKRVLKDDGCIIIGVPVWPHFKCAEHIYLLVEDSWEWMLSHADLGVSNKQSFEHSVLFCCKKL